MRTAVRYLVTAVGLTLVAGGALAAGLLQRQLADGERDLATST